MKTTLRPCGRRSRARGLGIRPARQAPPKKRFRSCRRACCCRISRACLRGGSRGDARRHARWAGIRRSQSADACRTVIDHSVQVDEYGATGAFTFNARWNFSATGSATCFCAGDRRRSRISKWCRRIPASFHQVNLEYLARVVFRAQADGACDGLSGFAGRHGFAYHDGQRSGRFWLGRGRH